MTTKPNTKAKPRTARQRKKEPDASTRKSVQSANDSAQSHELVTCLLDNVEFGMDIASVQEIVRLPKITPVPKAPDYVRGLANLRGNVLPVIDSRLRFGMGRNADERNCRVVVLEIGGLPTGLIVDAVREVMNVDAGRIEPTPPAVQGIDAEFVRGVAKLEDGNRLVMLIDQDKVIDLEGWDADAAHDAATTTGGLTRRVADVVDSTVDQEQLVSFRVAHEEFAFSIMDVKEIIRLPAITVVPDAPPSVEGITALRDRVVPVVNLRSTFGRETLQSQTTKFLQQMKEYQQLHDDKFHSLLAEIEAGATRVEVLRLRDCPFHQWYKTFKTDDEMIRDLIESLQAPHRSFHEICGRAAEHVARGAHAEALRLVDRDLRACHRRIDRLFRKLFAAVENRDDERCLVVSLGDSSVALRIDAVNEVMQVPRDSIESTPAAAHHTSGALAKVRGVAKLDQGKRLVMLLDAKSLVNAEDLAELESAVNARGPSEDATGGETTMSEKTETDDRQLVTFTVGEEEFASDIMSVQEIIRLGKVTKVPHAPDFLEGVVNLRGNVLPVIDLRRLFDMAPAKHTDATRVVVVDSNNRKTGIIVDAVSEVMTLPGDALEPAPAILHAGHDASFIEAVGKLDGGKRMLMLLRTDQLLGDTDLDALLESQVKNAATIEAELDDVAELVVDA